MRQHLLTSDSPAVRVLATPALKARIDAQGRRHDWIASRLGVSKSYLSKILSGQSSVAIGDARVIAALIDGELGVLFDVPGDNDLLPDGGDV